MLSASLYGLLLGFALLTLPAAAQTTAPNEWTWVGGDAGEASQGGEYGTQGTFSADNLPGGRANSSVWKDTQGRMWLFGGFGLISPGSFWDMDDLWIFDPAQGAHGEWTWQAGPQDPFDFGVYGTQPGEFSDQYVPGARLGAQKWLDKTGRLWLFGGWIYSGPYIGEMWVFDPTKGNFGQWAWMGGGNLSGVYGTLGQPAAANIPGARAWGATWTDAAGNLWLFGGNGVDANGNSAAMNDVWVFDLSAGQFGEWTWMGGSSTAPANGGQTGVYGALGEFNATNMPGGRNGEAFWTDSQGNLWLFGGEGIDSQGNAGDLADMWQFNPSLGQYGEWAFMGGSQVVSLNYTSVPGIVGIPVPANLPEQRNWAQFWKDSSGDFWLYGGDDDVYYGGPTMLYDLWVYSPTLTEWAEINPGVAQTDYGTEYVAAPSNYPGARDSGAVLADSADNVWIFGGRVGQGEDEQNDLWLYTPPPTAAAPLFSVPGGTYATAQNVTITDATAGAAIYYSTDGSTPSTGSNKYTGPVTIGPAGAAPVVTLDAIAVANGYLYSPMASAAYAIDPTATPDFSLAAGTYTSAQTVTISDTTPNATIYYAINGTPTTSSAQYTGAITVSSTETIEAIAVASGYSQSAAATAAYTIETPAATPIFSVPTGTYTAIQTVTISDTTPNAAIYYAINGTPTTSSTQYSGAITVSSSETIEAIAVASGYSESAVVSAAYSISPGFTMAGTAVTVTAGATSGNTSAITLTPTGGFTGNVALTAAITSGPAGGIQPTLSFGSTTPASITGAAAGTATLTITTTASSTTPCTAENHIQRGIPWYSEGGALLACVLLFGIPAQRRSWLKMLGISLLLVALAGGAVACGGGGGGGKTCNPTPIAGTMPGSYTITVTGVSNSITSTGIVSLTVQ
jgi:hypothetical protein